MLSNLSAAMNESTVSYPISDISLPFNAYINKTRAIIEERRPDLQKADINARLILDTNSPFELYPDKPIMQGNRIKYGALLIHGLLDCPFSLRDIGSQLQANGILSRAILLPGHGTTPADLINVSYHDWIQAVRYGVETLRKEVDQIYLIGYSTGAALSIYQALQDTQIAGIVLISPAIRLKAPVDIVVGWRYFLRLFQYQNKEWAFKRKEIDYAKYSSIPFNAINQVNKLTAVNQEVRQHHTFSTPIFMIVSREDETISSFKAINFFSNLHNAESRMLLYTSIDHLYPDPRIMTRLAEYRSESITHLSHTSLPFAANNYHYGLNGDYIHASRARPNEVIYGAYNVIEETIFDMLHSIGLLGQCRRELTYNPDFDYMSGKIIGFMTERF